MHPRNLYRSPPDFAKLCEVYPALKPHLVRTDGGPMIDFKNAEAQRCLTAALLYRDFGLTLVVPEDRLCPPVPNRLNYILWLHDIFSYISVHCPEILGETTTVLDIGTGASAIYPLLGCSVESRWRFIATEIDEKSFEYAIHNVERNHLQDRISIIKIDGGDPLFPQDADDPTYNIQFGFSMCNPPFYASRQEVLESAEAKEIGPRAVCTGADNEMITPGGEVAFVRRMIHESLQMRTKYLWYTSMLGKMSSLTEIIGLLRTEKVENYAITEFVQGRTRRWAIAWSFTDLHLPDPLARISNTTLQGIQSPRNTFSHSYARSISQEPFVRITREVLDAIDGVYVHADEQLREDAALLTVHAAADTWSRAARRRKTKTPNDLTSGQPPHLLCEICVKGAKTGRVPTLEFQWVKGVDRNLFESFINHIGRKVAARLDSLGTPYLETA